MPEASPRGVGGPPIQLGESAQLVGTHVETLRPREEHGIDLLDGRPIVSAVTEAR